MTEKPSDLHRKFFVSKVLPLVLLFFLQLVPSLYAADNYKIVYLLTGDIELALDYEENIETVLAEAGDVSLQVMGKGDNYAVVERVDGSVRTLSKRLVHNSELLDQAGYDPPFASLDDDFYPLYNVSYGAGPNLDALKKVYNKVYAVLGGDVGRNLFIEKGGSGNYVLIYRRRGDKRSTSVVARRHGKILRKKRIRPSITVESNNEVVFGESSLLDESDTTHVVDKGIEKSREEQAIDEIAGAVKPLQPPTPPRRVQPLPVQEKVYLAYDKSRGKKIHLSVPLKLPSLQVASQFEKDIERYIASLRQKGKISSDEATGWMVYDLASDEPMVDINANRKFQTASMIKPFVALAFFHKVKEGKLKYGPKSRRKMALMIQRSNNAATNWVMRQVGGPASCQKILDKYYSHIFRGLELREYIPAGGRTYKNKAYPSDYVRFLRELWDKKLPYSREMRRLMALPGRDRLYFGTPIPRGTLVYNKTGSTAHLCGDMGILVPKTKSGSRYPYVIVGIIEKKSRPGNYGNWVASRSKVIRQVSTLVYKEMKREHRLR